MSSDSDSKICTPPEIRKIAEIATRNLLPDKSHKYNVAYQNISVGVQIESESASGSTTFAPGSTVPENATQEIKESNYSISSEKTTAAVENKPDEETTTVKDMFDDDDLFESLVSQIDDESAKGEKSDKENNLSASGSKTSASGSTAFASGSTAFASGSRTFASGSTAYASGSRTFASGSTAFASGSRTSASGSAAFASGSRTFALGSTASTSGSRTFASGSTAFASGSRTSASGSAAFASGSRAFASGSTASTSGSAAFALGSSTLASESTAFASGSTVPKNATQKIKVQDKFDDDDLFESFLSQYDDKSAKKSDDETNLVSENWRETILKPDIPYEEIVAIRNRRRGLPQLFILDVLQAKPFRDKYTGQYNQYTVRGLIFERVSIRGVIVGITQQEHPRYEVSDHTATVACYFQNRTSFDNLNRELDEYMEQKSKNYDRTNLRQKAAFMLLNNTKSLMKKIAAPADLEVGQTVSILGNMDIYKGTPYVFIYRAEIEDNMMVDEDLNYVEHLNHLYDNIYLEVADLNAALINNL